MENQATCRGGRRFRTSRKYFFVVFLATASAYAVEPPIDREADEPRPQVEVKRVALSTMRSDIGREVDGVTGAEVLPVFGPRMIPRGVEVLSGGGSTAGSLPPCPGPVVNALTDNSFTGGTYVIQAGFAEREIAAVSFTLNPSDFPVTLRSVEGIFAQVATEQTTTLYSVLVWDGTPRDGLLVAEFRSDDPQVLPLVMQSGTQGTNVQILIDTNDPEQIVVENLSQTNIISVGYRIDRHNAPPANPCLLPPPSNRNAFPTTDQGLNFPSANWIFALDCGALACPGGWKQFADYGPLCRPTGDWMIRVTYECTPSNVPGACCFGANNCVDNTNFQTCRSLFADFMGEGSRCATVTCPEPVGACCLPELNACFDFTDAELCSNLSGFYGGGGTECDEGVCRVGACCLPDGSCRNEVAGSCGALGGTYDPSRLCSAANCPQPRGACCVGTFCVPNQTRQQCEQGQGAWRGANVACGASTCVGCAAGELIQVSPDPCTLDARQPHPPADGGPGSRQGIGNSAEPITVQLSVSGASASCFGLSETEIEEGLSPNAVALVSEGPAGIYRIELNRPISTRAITTLFYRGAPVVSYGSHPANVNNDGASDAADLEFFFSILQGEEIAPFGLYSFDVDRSGFADLQDAIRIVDLLNGAAAYEAWGGQSKPATEACP